MRKGDKKCWMISFFLLPIFLLTVEGVYSHPSINCEQTYAQEELEGSLKKWHEGPVGYIILKEEKDRFKKLKTREERMRFIQIFWDRRDYNPETLINELREEFYARVEYANENFKEGSLAGWKTARGQIYIVLGPPDREWKEIVSGISARPAYLWQYYRLASAYLNPNEPLVFADLYGSGKYFLLRPYPQTYFDYYWQVQKGRSYFEPVPDEYQRALDDIKEKYIFQPDISYDQPSTAAPPPQIKEPLPPKLPFNWSTSFSEQPSGLIAIQLTVMVRYADFRYYREGDTYKVDMEFLGELKDAADNVVDKVTENISLSLTSKEITDKKDELYTLTTQLKAKPGKYQLVLQLVDRISGVTSRSVETISVPAPK